MTYAGLLATRQGHADRRIRANGKAGRLLLFRRLKRLSRPPAAPIPRLRLVDLVGREGAGTPQLEQCRSLGQSRTNDIYQRTIRVLYASVNGRPSCGLPEAFGPSPTMRPSHPTTTPKDAIPQRVAAGLSPAVP